MSLKINSPFPNMNLNYLWMNWQMAEENNEIQRLQKGDGNAGEPDACRKTEI